MLWNCIFGTCIPPLFYSFGCFFLLSIRTSSTRDLTFFSDKAMAVNRQLAQQDDMEDQQHQEVPYVVNATGSSVRLSPPSNSKLARRRQRNSQPKGGPVSAAELRQLLAPLVIVGDCAWTWSWNSDPHLQLGSRSKTALRLSHPVLTPLSDSSWPWFPCYSGFNAAVKGDAACSPFSKCLLPLSSTSEAHQHRACI